MKHYAPRCSPVLPTGTILEPENAPPRGGYYPPPGSISGRGMGNQSFRLPPRRCFGEHHTCLFLAALLWGTLAAVVPNGSSSNLSARPPLERRARREEVRRRLIRGDRVSEIAEQVAGMHGVSPRMIFKDIRLIRRKIMRGDPTMALRQVQALEGYARDLESLGPTGLESAADVRFKIARLLGMGTTSHVVNVDARTVSVQAPVIDSALIAAALAQLGSVAALPTNGHVVDATVVARNGDANGNA